MKSLQLNWIPILVFLVLLIHGSSLGLTDDEAYYWVLAQRPALGYAYHPPAVAWLIALFQTLLGWVRALPAPGLVRLPAALSIALILSLSLNWLRDVGLKPVYNTRAALVLLSFFGFFSLGWMMVPDIPLFLGWTLLFTATWKICFSEKALIAYVNLALASALILLSKYSGALAVASAGICLLIWAPQSKRMKGIGSLVLGTLAALTPILIWNSRHEWASILYQIHDRHEGARVSLFRYLKFWIVESLLAGPVLVGFSFVLIKNALMGRTNKSAQTLYKFVAIWMGPAAAIFCVQPILSDFKPHWAFIVWWPVALALAWVSQGPQWKWIRFQSAYGLSLGSFVLLSCHLPLGGWMNRVFVSDEIDPRLDVTNDLYGWSDLKLFFRDRIESENAKLPVIGSRYQTASQAAFSLYELGQAPQVTLLPKDIKEKDEWPNLKVSESEGPQWPELTHPVLFVTDNRYDAAPEFPKTSCKKLGRLQKSRFNLLAKWIEIWRCDPSRS